MLNLSGINVHRICAPFQRNPINELFSRGTVETRKFLPTLCYLFCDMKNAANLQLQEMKNFTFIILCGLHVVLTKCIMPSLRPFAYCSEDLKITTDFRHFINK